MNAGRKALGCNGKLTSNGKLKAGYFALTFALWYLHFGVLSRRQRNVKQRELEVSKPGAHTV
jgi:hypothetical protein